MRQLAATILIATLTVAYGQTVRSAVMGNDTANTFIIGEIRFTEAVGSVDVFAIILDASGREIGRGEATAFRSHANAHEDIPFAVTIRGPLENAADFTIEAYADEPRDRPTLDTRILSTQDEVVGRKVFVEIANSHDQPVDVSRLVASGYVGARVVAVGMTFPGFTLGPGATRQASVTLQHEVEVPVDYRVWAEGRF